jgi:hypothetical protein
MNVSVEDVAPCVRGIDARPRRPSMSNVFPSTNREASTFGDADTSGRFTAWIAAATGPGGSGEESAHAPAAQKHMDTDARTAKVRIRMTVLRPGR